MDKPHGPPPPTHLVSLEELVERPASLDALGVVGLRLLEARRAGVPTVDTWVLSAHVFRDIARGALPPNHDPGALLRVVHRAAGLERTARARERLLTLPLPTEVQAELEARWPEIGRDARGSIAVRASPTCEDSLAAEAGLLGVTLGIGRLSELEQAVREAWASGVYEDALRFLREHKTRDLAIAVVIQRLSPVRASGVLYPRDPTNTRIAAASSDAPFTKRATTAQSMRARLVLCGLGLGPPVIDGAAARDVLRFRNGKMIEQHRAPKRQKLVFTSRGLQVVDLADEQARRSALPDRALVDVERAAERLEMLHDDLEAEFVLTQNAGLKITTLHRYGPQASPAGGAPDTVWSRACFGEPLPNVPTPLTWSLGRGFEEKALRLALRSLGVRVSRSAPLLGRVRGRVYFNLSVLVPALGEVPGIDPLTLVDYVRGPAQERIATQLAPAKRSVALARLSLTAARLAALQRRLSDEVERFESAAEQQRRWLAEMDLGILPDDSLKTTLLEAHHFFKLTGRVLLTCAVSALAAHVGLKTVLGRSAPVEAERIAQIIGCGTRRLASVEPAVALAHVAGIVERDPPARDAVLGSAVSLDAVPAGPGRRAIAQFLDAYGDRALREMELMTSRWSEQPEQVLRMIACRVAAHAEDPERLLSHARVRADRELAALEARLPYVERVLMRSLVSRARELGRLREQMRVWMARTLGMIRIVALDVDRRMRRLDRSLDEGAAFFCTFEELVDAASSFRADLGPIVRQRRAAYLRDLDREDPPDTFLGAPTPRALAPMGGAVLHGLPNSPGVIVGPARIIDARGRGTERVRPGDVVVLRAFDAALAPLFASASGLVADLGGPLSHGAVLARELGVPAVGAVVGASTTVFDGERLRVDGDRGVVERLDA